MQRMMSRLILGVVLLGSLSVPTAFGVVPPQSRMEARPPVEERIAALEQQVRDAHSAGDNSWMLMCAALVLMMTGPGLALFYGGLVRKKNVLATMMQSFILMAVVTVAVGAVWLQPGLSRRQSLHWELRLPVSAWGGRRPRPRIMPQPSRSRPSWSINSCLPSLPRR